MAHDEPEHLSCGVDGQRTLRRLEHGAIPLARRNRHLLPVEREAGELGKGDRRALDSGANT